MAATSAWSSTTRKPRAKRWLMQASRPCPVHFSTFSTLGATALRFVGYTNVQFTKEPNVLRGMGLTHLSKNATAIKELTDKGMAPR